MFSISTIFQEAEQREYELKLAKMREEQEARTAKKRAKRQKKKGKQGKKPAGKPGTGLGEDESEDEGDGASEAGSEGSPAVNRDEGAPDNSKEAGARETAGTGQSEADDRPVPKITRAPPSLPLELEPQGEVKRMEPNVKIIEDDDM